MSGVDRLLARARAGLHRLTPAEAAEAQAQGALIVDTRTDSQRREQGALPGALVVDPRPDFYLQSPVAKPDRLLGQVEDPGKGFPADADADWERTLLATPELPERCFGPLGDDVPHGGFDAALVEHRALDPGVALPQRIDSVDGAARFLMACARR